MTLKKLSTRIASYLLVVMMLCTMFSTVTLAAEDGLKNVYLDGAGWHNGWDGSDGASLDTPVKSFAKAQELVATGGTIWCMSITIVAEEETWDLTDKPGVIVKRAQGERIGSMVSVMSGGSLTIKNIVFDGALRNDDGSANVTTKSNASAFTVQDSGKLVMDTGSVIENSNSTNYGAGVYVNNSANLTMQGNSSIRNNHTTELGGGILSQGTSTVNIKDNATITGNSGSLGGGVYVASSLNLLGGSISNNIALDSGGGVFIDRTASNVKFTGGVISENTAQGQVDPESGLGHDIYSNGNQKWTLAGDWKTSQGIFLNAPAKMYFTSKVKNPIQFEGILNTVKLEGTVVAEGSDGYNLTIEDLSQFSCKEQSTGFELDATKNQIKVKIIVPYTVDFDINGGAGKDFTQKVYPKNKVIKPSDPTKNGFVFSGWYNGSAAFDFENEIISKNIKLIAKWHEHSFDNNWKSDSTNHWQECVSDGAKSDIALHTPGKPATIDHGQVCTVCGHEISPKLLSKEIVVDDTTGTKIEYENGSVFDSTITLDVTPKNKDEMKQYQEGVDKIVKGMVIGGLYDIKLLKDGVEIQPDGKLKITLILTDAMKSMTDLQVVYIDGDGNVTMMPSQLVDGNLVFVTDHFSYYGVIGKEKQINPSSTQNPSSPQTGDTSNTMLYFGLIVLTAGLVGLSFKKKNQQK